MWFSLMRNRRAKDNRNDRLVGADSVEKRGVAKLSTLVTEVGIRFW